jgi:carbamoyl-phosphate synthase small subunit
MERIPSLTHLKAVLQLVDGSKFFGVGFGYPSETAGEVVFNTGMVGYPEALTDPSYFSQILVQTYPLLGNYGVPSLERRDAFGLPSDLESEKVQVMGYVVQTPSSHPSHRTSEKSLGRWLVEEKIPAIGGIDTRRLTKKLRIEGVMLGILKVAEEISADDLDDEIRGISDPNEVDLVKEVTIKKPVHYGEGKPKIVVIDCGVKYGIIRNLLIRGASVTRVPYTYPVDKILDINPSGVVISNGPGEPKNCVKTIDIVSELLYTGLPLMGICLGNQLLALAAGGDTFKLKFGHRGQNHPCLDLSSGRCYITSQNHGFSVDAESLKDTDFKVSLVNANDGTVEGIKHAYKPVFGVQFHPEGSPGPLDTEFLFDEFIKEAQRCRY